MNLKCVQTARAAMSTLKSVVATLHVLSVVGKDIAQKWNAQDIFLTDRK